MVFRNNSTTRPAPAPPRLDPKPHRPAHGHFALSRADGAGMKVLIALVLAFSFYAIGCADGRNRQIQTPTAIHQLPQ